MPEAQRRRIRFAALGFAEPALICDLCRHDIEARPWVVFQGSLVIVVCSEACAREN